MKFARILLLLFTLSLLNCDQGGKDIPSSLVFPLLQSTEEEAGPYGTNLAQVTFDGWPFDDQPVISCDINNSSGDGIVIDLPDTFPPDYVIKIETVPSVSPFTFPTGGDLDLYFGISHKPDNSTNCILTRTSNTSRRYSASISSSCTPMNHTLTRLEIDCIPD
ncbi:hypothetical protein [Leptospira sarikeiensis]|uniref:Uncharacterized protein n=1 Tax=Leptospira sarikeiensis TaxID=2484943 RepID=A0A4R9K4L1_9LEPT|nr:hypothetical protein [Leptospira sarikeiensis]TGL59248.1 hypothetical protein EHQ64_16315 [Leptospira sarikeiensis]